jgi:hypothetical protein
MIPIEFKTFYMKIVFSVIMLIFCATNLVGQGIECVGVEMECGYFYQLALPGQKKFSAGTGAYAEDYFFVTSGHARADGVEKLLEKRYGRLTKKGYRDASYDTIKFVSRLAPGHTRPYDLASEVCRKQIDSAISILPFDSTARAWRTTFHGRKLYVTYVKARWLHLRVHSSTACERGLDRPRSYDCDGPPRWFDYYLPLQILIQKPGKVKNDNLQIADSK